MPDHQTKVPDAVNAGGSDILTELSQQVKDGLITAAEAWRTIELAAAAKPVIDRTSTDHLEVVIGRDQVWINEGLFNIARWYNIKSLSVRDIRTPVAA